MSMYFSSTPVLRALLLLAAGSTVLINAPLQAQSGPGKPVATEAKPKTAATTATQAGIPATVQWLRRVELSTALSTTVAEVLVEAGDAVRKDQVLLRLDARAFEAQEQKTATELNRLRATRDEAGRELQRAEVLHRRKLLSDHELQTMRIAASSAEANFSAAQAANVQAQLNLEHCTVRAPFDGVVLQRLAERGQTVVSTTKPVPLLVVAETARMRARAEVQRDALAEIRRGQTLQVGIADRTFPGVVKFIGLEPLDGLGGQFAQYELVVEFSPPADAELYAGQPAQLTVP